MGTNRILDREEAERLNISERIRLEQHLMDSVLVNDRLFKLPETWRFDDYMNQSPWKKHQFKFLGSVKNKVILDLGCGYNPTSIYFARAGAQAVIAGDISTKTLAYVQKMAGINNVEDKISVLLCAGETIPLATNSVDIVHGEGVLHHLKLKDAGKEIERVLKPGGKAVFKDPLGENPLLEFARDRLPYKWKHAAKGTDRPLTTKELKQLKAHQFHCSCSGFCLTGMLARAIWGRDLYWPQFIFDRLDRFLLKNFPTLQRYCRYVVTCVTN